MLLAGSVGNVGKKMAGVEGESRNRSSQAAISDSAGTKPHPPIACASPAAESVADFLAVCTISLA
jgi:hypothetical protein